ncbi:MAG: acylphosphatase [Flavobacteriales bacterium]|nr:acylphosphatase [Flavobacteriales bacterium]
MTIAARQITVSGKVQGVWFRKYTCDKAREFGLKGTVQNLETGQVLIHAIGPPQLVASLEQWCWQGSPESKVTDVRSVEVEPKPYTTFDIIE